MFKKSPQIGDYIDADDDNVTSIIQNTDINPEADQINSINDSSDNANEISEELITSRHKYDLRSKNTTNDSYPGHFIHGP